MDKLKCRECGSKDLENAEMVCGKELMFEPICVNCQPLAETFFPPPWNIYENEEKTIGWVEFQKAMKKDPKYYLEGLDLDDF